MSPGQTVHIEIEGIGTLSTPIESQPRLVKGLRCPFGRRRSSLALTAVGPAGGYRLRSRSVWVPSSAQADRWQRSDFPLRFRMLENDNAPVGVDLSQDRWTAIVERSLVHWTEIPTARIEIVLEEATVQLPQADQDDGINTIGFSAHEDFVDSWFTAWAAWRWDGDRLVGCDIEVNPDFVKNWGPQDPYRLLEIVMIHEMGHCLGTRAHRAAPDAALDGSPGPGGSVLPARPDDVVFEFVRTGTFRGRHRGGVAALPRRPGSWGHVVP